MIRTVLLTSLFALAVPAMAQETQTPASEPPASEPPAAEASTTEAPASTGTAPAEDPAATPSASARPATSDEVGTLVAGEFPRRDLDSNGSLNQEEFTSWVGELMSRSPDGAGSASDPAKISSAFSQADSDSNSSVSPAEMIALLSRSR